MEYVPGIEGVTCYQEMEKDGTCVAKLEFLDAWDDLYEAIVHVHREAMRG